MNELLLLPKCELAEAVVYCWHDIIKNKIQSFGDPFLESWLDEAEDVQKFEAVLEHVVEDLEGFSPARAAAKLAPVANMSETMRQELLTKLDEAFQRGFAPGKVRERLRAVIRPLRDALQEYKNTRDRCGRAECVLTLRAAAVAARQELEALPAGFWLPRHSREAKRA